MKEWLDKYGKDPKYAAIVQRLELWERLYQEQRAELDQTRQDPGHARLALDFYQQWATTFDQEMLEVVKMQERIDQQHKAYVKAVQALADAAKDAIELLRELIAHGLAEEARDLLRAITQAHRAAQNTQMGEAAMNAIGMEQTILDTVVKEYSVALAKKKEGG